MEKKQKYGLDIQLFAEDNIIKTPDMGEVNAIDFVERFGDTTKKLSEALGITRPHKMSQGDTIKRYKFTVTKPTGDAGKGIVPEGDDIPLTHVKREEADPIKLTFRKYRKAVTIEEVQRVGYDRAVSKSDKEVLKTIYKDIRNDFFTYLATAPTKITASGLQDAFGKAWGKLGTIFDDEAVDSVYFINPEDAGDYLGAEAISNGQSVGFGLTLLKGFTGANLVLVVNNIPRGKVYATAIDNINMMYLDVLGEAAKLFEDKPVITEELGLIGLVKSANTTNLTNQSSIYLGLTLFAEVVNGVVEVTIPVAGTEEASGASAVVLEDKEIYTAEDFAPQAITKAMIKALADKKGYEGVNTSDTKPDMITAFLAAQEAAQAE